MDTLVVKPTARKRRRHSAEFKRQVIEACQEPGVSVAAIALANGLNANYLRQWVREHREATAVVERSAALCEAVNSGTPAMVLATVTAEPEPNRPSLEIRLDVRRGGTTVQMAWPLEAVASLGQCLRELLR
jgi:transposase-like protein